MEKYYRFAGVELAVSIADEWMYGDDRQLAPFRVSQVSAPHSFTFEIVDQLSAPQGEELVAFSGFRVYHQGERTIRYVGTVANGWDKAYIRVEHEGRQHRVQLKASQFSKTIGVKPVLTALGAEHLVLEENGVIFHSSFIGWNGKGILFTAPSGTGKSTQAELWRTLRGAEIINGDRSVIRCLKDGVYAEGIPFSGSSQYCENRILPLTAIVYLAQAPETSVSKLRGVQAFRRIWEGISVNTWDREDVQRAMNLVQNIAVNVPVFYLPCTPDESAVTALEEELKKLEMP